MTLAGLLLVAVCSLFLGCVQLRYAAGERWWAGRSWTMGFLVAQVAVATAFAAFISPTVVHLWVHRNPPAHLTGGLAATLVGATWLQAIPMKKAAGRLISLRNFAIGQVQLRAFARCSSHEIDADEPDVLTLTDPEIEQLFTVFFERCAKVGLWKDSRNPKSYVSDIFQSDSTRLDRVRALLATARDLDAYALLHEIRRRAARRRRTSNRLSPRPRPSPMRHEEST